MFPRFRDLESARTLQHEVSNSISRSKRVTEKASFTMLWTIAVILLVLWALGMVSSYTMGGFIHALLVLALMALISCLIRGGNSKRLAELTAAGETSTTGQSS